MDMVVSSSKALAEGADLAANLRRRSRTRQ